MSRSSAYRSSLLWTTLSRNALSFSDNRIDGGAVHEGDQRGDAALDGELAGVGWLDAVDGAARREIREQRTVVGANVDDQILVGKRVKTPDFLRHLREVLTKD